MITTKTGNPQEDEEKIKKSIFIYFYIYTFIRFNNGCYGVVCLLYITCSRSIRLDYREELGILTHHWQELNTDRKWVLGVSAGTGHSD
jgi:hypothetical protein